LARGMGDLFLHYWNSFGSLKPENHNGKAEQASMFRQEIRNHISNMKSNLPINEIRRIIQELLTELQQDEDTNGND